MTASRFGCDPSGMGSLITRYRARRGLTQRKLAAAAGVSLGAVRDLEQGRTPDPRWGTVESIAAALEVSQHERAELLWAWRADPRTTATAIAKQPGSGWAPVRVGVLGPVRASLGGAEVMLGPPRQRALLGLLAVQHGGSVHRDAIIDALWPSGEPPPSALAQLQSYIWRLRNLLPGPGGNGETAQLIATVGAGYQLRAEEDQLDVAAFRRMVGAARRAAAQRRPAEAGQLYEHALDLWRGEVLADVDVLRDHPAITELTHQHSDAVLGSAAAAIRAGTPDRALPRLRKLCEKDPFHETAHAQLMIALAATGHQAAALDAFGMLRRRLRSELGVCPGPELTRAHSQILRQQLGSR